MTMVANLSDASTDAEESELLYVQQAAGPRKRTFGSLWRNVLGRTAAAQRAFFGATPIAQPAGATQAAVTPTIGTAVATTAATNTTPYGYTTQAQADRIVALLNETRADAAAAVVLVNKLRADLVALGLIKGST